MSETKTSRPHKLASRLTEAVISKRRADGNSMLRTIAMFAALADGINTLFTPDLYFRGMLITGTFCNLTGSWIAGISEAMILGKSSEELSLAFRGGFVAAYTSFTHMVEHSAALHCGHMANSSSQFYLVTSLLAGPLCFYLGYRSGCRVMRIVRRAYPKSPMSGKDVLRLTRYVLIVLLVLELAVAVFRGGLEAVIGLVAGMMMAILACVVGDSVALIVSEVLTDLEQPNDVNWGTIGCNILALGLVNVCAYWGSWFTFVFPAFTILLLDKFRGSFCGALSAYGGYSEDVVVALTKGKISEAAANIGMNALAVLLSIAFLSHAQCPFGIWQAQA